MISPAAELRNQIACFSWNPATKRYEVVIGIHSKEVVERFRTLREVRDFVEGYNAALCQS